MPYISEVEVNGVTYDVKDKEVREELENIDERIEDSLDNLIKAQSAEPSEDGNKIWIDTDVNEVTVPEIDDNDISLVNTWSSSKINGEVSDLKSVKVNTNQGVAQAGKALVVGQDGLVTTGDAGIPEAVKTSLLNLVRHVAYIDDQGQAYYDALYAALYGGSGGYPRLQAVYAPGTHVVYTDDALDTLREYLTVKRYESAQDSGTVVTDYTLSGTLVDGLSTVLVRKDGLVTAVQVEAVDFYNIHVRSVEAGSLSMLAASVDPNQDDTTKYPSRLLMLSNYELRRNFSVVRGKAPYYEKNQTAVPTAYYPIPIPADANKIRITMNPSGRYLYLNTVPYDEASVTYLNYISENRVTWTQLTDGVLEKEITNPGNLFMILNSKYDEAGQSYPTNPTNLTIEFLEA